ncbi:DNA polymerase zeta catalytic subunit [Lycorma delicatula]|uniref:DNA polymerase zeta catalytic subunit n=1 Tax=Lycorma delicatula TaxID=130591 RepID=UPI003F513E6B
MVSLRIVTVDHYMSTPISGLDVTYSDFRGCSIKQVPVLRIFGSTDDGKKACLHIHGVFPYIYVPYDGEISSGQSMYQLAASLDKALNISLGTSNSTRNHVYKIVHVAGRPFYGYHEKLHQYFKIYFYNPLIIKRAADLLQNGAVCNKVYQCHEAHVPFILQFFIDYNLYGMSFIELNTVLFREDSLHSPDKILNIDDENKNATKPVLPPRITYCEIEADGLACDILNIKTTPDNIVANPGLAGIWAEEKARRKNNFGTSQITPQNSQPRTNVQCTISEIMLNDKLKEAIDKITSLGDSLSLKNTKDVPYPAESQENDKLLEASQLDSILMQKSVNLNLANGNVTDAQTSSQRLAALEDSIVNEELVLSLSQAAINESMIGTQDCSLLLMMQSLAEQNEASEVDRSQIVTKHSSQQPFNNNDIEEGSVLHPSLVPVNNDHEQIDELDEELQKSKNNKTDGSEIVNEDISTENEEEQCKVWDGTIWNDCDDGGCKIMQVDGAADDLLTDNIKQKNINNKVSRSNDGAELSNENNLVVNEQEVNKDLVINEQEVNKDLVINEQEVNKDLAINEQEVNKHFVNDNINEQELKKMSNDEDDDDDGLDGLKTIFDQDSTNDQFWTQEQENMSEELQNEIFRDNINSDITLLPDNIIDCENSNGTGTDSFIGDSDNDITININSAFNSVLMGDPSFMSQAVVEASSDDIMYTNRNIAQTCWSSNIDSIDGKQKYNPYFSGAKEKDNVANTEDSLNDSTRIHKEVNLEFTDSTSESVLYPTSELLLSCINDGVCSSSVDTIPRISSSLAENSDYEVYNDVKNSINASLDTKNLETEINKDENIKEKSVEDEASVSTNSDEKKNEISKECSDPEYTINTQESCSKNNLPEGKELIPYIFKISKRYVKMNFVVKKIDNVAPIVRGNAVLLKYKKRMKRIRKCVIDHKIIGKFENVEDVTTDMITRYYKQLDDLKKILHERECSTTVKPIYWNDIEIDKKLRNCSRKQICLIKEKNEMQCGNKNQSSKCIEDDDDDNIEKRSEESDVFVTKSIKDKKPNQNYKSNKIKKSGEKNFSASDIKDNELKINKNKIKNVLLPNKNKKSTNFMTPIKDKKNIFKLSNKKVNNNANGKNSKKKIICDLDEDIHICRSVNCEKCSEKSEKETKNKFSPVKSKTSKTTISPKNKISTKKKVCDKIVNLSSQNLKKSVNNVKKQLFQSSSLKNKKKNKSKEVSRVKLSLKSNNIKDKKKLKFYPCRVFVEDIKHKNVKEICDLYGVIYNDGQKEIECNKMTKTDLINKEMKNEGVLPPNSSSSSSAFFKVKENVLLKNSDDLLSSEMLKCKSDSLIQGVESYPCKHICNEMFSNKHCSCNTSNKSDEMPSVNNKCSLSIEAPKEDSSKLEIREKLHVVVNKINDNYYDSTSDSNMKNNINVPSDIFFLDKDKKLLKRKSSTSSITTVPYKNTNSESSYGTTCSNNNNNNNNNINDCNKSSCSKNFNNFNVEQSSPIVTSNDLNISSNNRTSSSSSFEIKRRRISNDVNEKDKERNNFKKYNDTNKFLVPCIDGAIDDISSSSSSSSAEDNTTLNEMDKHKKLVVKVNSLKYKEQSSKSGKRSLRNFPITPPKRRYEPLDVLIKRSPHLSSKTKVVNEEINKASCSTDYMISIPMDIDAADNFKQQEVVEVDNKIKHIPFDDSVIIPTSSSKPKETMEYCSEVKVDNANLKPLIIKMERIKNDEINKSKIKSESSFDKKEIPQIFPECYVNVLKPCWVVLKKENIESTCRISSNSNKDKSSAMVICDDKSLEELDYKLFTKLQVSLTKLSNTEQSGHLHDCNYQKTSDICNLQHPCYTDDKTACDNEQIIPPPDSSTSTVISKQNDQSELNSKSNKGNKKYEEIFVSSDNENYSDDIDDDDNNDEIISPVSKSSGSIYCEKILVKDCGSKARKMLTFDDDCNVESKNKKQIKMSTDLDSNSSLLCSKIESPVLTVNICKSQKTSPTSQNSDDTVITMFSNDLTQKLSDDSSTHKNDEDNGILSFYDKSVYFGEDLNNSSDSDDSKSIINFERYSSSSENDNVDETAIYNEDGGPVYKSKEKSTLSDTISLETYSNSDCDDKDISKINIIESDNYTVFVPELKPPTFDDVIKNISKYNLPEVKVQEPFFSNPEDVANGVEVGGVKIKINSNCIDNLEEYKGSFDKGTHLNTFDDDDTVIAPFRKPPSYEEAKKWLKVKSNFDKKNILKTCAEENVLKDIKSQIPNKNSSGINSQNADPVSPSTSEINNIILSESINLQHSTPIRLDDKKVLSLPIISPSFTPVTSKNRMKNIFNRKRLSKNFNYYSSTMPLINEESISNARFNENEKMTLKDSQETINSSDVSEESRIKIEVQLKNSKQNNRSSSCCIEGASPNSSTDGNFRVGNENLQEARSVVQYQHLTLMGVELHIHTRGDLRPDPEYDQIKAIFYSISNDVPVTSDKPIKFIGIISTEKLEKATTISYDSVLCVPDEKSLVFEFIQLVRKWDPDIFLGYEIEMLSWGYLIQRAYNLNMNLNVELSRVIGTEGFAKYEDDKGMLGGDSEEFEVKLAGRIILNVWRLLRHEVALQSYTFENIAYHILRKRIPLFSFRTLTQWWEHRSNVYKWLVVEHYITRVTGIIQLLDQLDLIGRTSELARLFGIQFYEVLSRGSQFRVESMMLRMAKPQNYVAVSPSISQRAKMRAPESLPLIMEPHSRLYNDPVIVLDFQSLYPSIIIAYNYCYSTCLGRVEHLAKYELFEFGCTHLRLPFKTIFKLKDSLNYSPSGIAFVNSSVRRGILPIMLEEILETRLMVKKSLKENKGNKTLQRVLHNRQLGLKLIANVTYGYTAANFSGRMPSVEIGDSVVSKGRETLERAIAMVNNTKKWGAQVVYGDTDSLFVLVPGRTRKQAFEIGAEIAEAVTNDNPKPVKLKLEKIYQPCILQTKKRYVGYMYESSDQEMPVFDDKGIETVRRDGCPAVVKILEKSLRILFETKDVSLVKQYVNKQFSKILTGRLSIQELTFAKEYRGASAYRPGACVPALELAREWVSKDRRAEPRVGERVPYVIVAGHPGVSLISLVRSPYSLLNDPGLKVNAEYYITRVIIPPLNRCFTLIGTDVHQWYTDLPRKHHTYLPTAVPTGIKKATISQYFATVNCIICQKQAINGICDECQLQTQRLATELAMKINNWERKYYLSNKLCQSCCGRSDNIDCISLDCPVFYKLHQTKRDLNQSAYIQQLQHDYLSF